MGIEPTNDPHRIKLHCQSNFSSPLTHIKIHIQNQYEVPIKVDNKKQRKQPHKKSNKNNFLPCFKIVSEQKLLIPINSMNNSWEQ